MYGMVQHAAAIGKLSENRRYMFDRKQSFQVGKNMLDYVYCAAAVSFANRPEEIKSCHIGKTVKKEKL